MSEIMTEIIELLKKGEEIPEDLLDKMKKMPEQHSTLLHHNRMLKIKEEQEQKLIDMKRQSDMQKKMSKFKKSKKSKSKKSKSNKSKSKSKKSA